MQCNKQAIEHHRKSLHMYIFVHTKNHSRSYMTWKCLSIVYLWCFVNPGCLADAILIPTPFYGVITEDVDLYSSVKLYCVPLDSEVLSQCPLLLSVLVIGVAVFMFHFFQPSAQPKWWQAISPHCRKTGACSPESKERGDSWSTSFHTHKHTHSHS